MSDDDLLREASDPTTSAERLGDLWALAESEEGPGTDEAKDVLVGTILRNPSLDLETLRGVLIDSVDCKPFHEAWHNPVVPLLLQSEPRPEFEQTARRLLEQHARAAGTHHISDADPDGSLADHVSAWAREVDPRATEAELRVRALARHLASLFGLPWPEP